MTFLVDRKGMLSTPCLGKKINDVARRTFWEKSSNSDGWRDGGLELDTRRIYFGLMSPRWDKLQTANISKADRHWVRPEW